MRGGKRERERERNDCSLLARRVLLHVVTSGFARGGNRAGRGTFVLKFWWPRGLSTPRKTSLIRSRDLLYTNNPVLYTRLEGCVCLFILCGS